MILKYDDIHLPDEGDNIIRTKEVELDPSIRGMGDELYKAMIRYKDRIAQIYAETGESDTFTDMLEKCVRVAVNLKRMGVTTEDILTPCTDFHLNTAVILIAIILTGAKVASIDPFDPDDDRIKQLSLIKPKMIFCSMNALQRAVAMIKKLKLNTKIVVFGQSDDYMSFDELLVPHIEEEKLFVPYVPKTMFETFLIVFSSGTTGRPSAICIHDYGALDFIYSTPGYSDVNRKPATFMAFSSLVWFTDVLIICTMLIYGNRRLICPNFEPKAALKYMEKYKVTNTFLLPTEMLAIMNAKPKELELPNLISISTAGAACSAEMMIKVRKAFPGTFILSCYGQTESGGGATFFPLATADDLKRVNSKPGSCGKPIQGSQVKICDPNTGSALGPNEIGEFCIKSKRIMVEYYKQDSSYRFDSEGFLKTGDLLYYDDDGYFYFVERLKEVLRYNLCSINPADIEGILHEHPGVELAVVLGLPSDGGDLPIGVVVRGDKAITEKELDQFVADRVDPKKKLHGGVMFVKKSYIPFTPSGKVRRRLLRTKLLQEDKLPLENSI